MTPDQNQDYPLRLVVVDDHAFAREAVAQALDAEPGFEIVGQAGSVAEAREVIERCAPDVAVLDLNMPDGSGRELVRHFSTSSPAIRCVVYTSLVSASETAELLADGAAAVVMKTLRGTELVDAIRGVATTHLDA